MVTQFGLVFLMCLGHSIMSRLAQPIPFLVSQFTNHFDGKEMPLGTKVLLLHEASTSDYVNLT